MTEQPMIQKVCAECGSDDVSVDACARWNPEAGAWELSATYDNAHCGKCDGEIKEIADEPLLGFKLLVTKTQWSQVVRAIKEDIITQARMIVEDDDAEDTVSESKVVVGHLLDALEQLDAERDEKLLGEDEATQAAYEKLLESLA